MSENNLNSTEAAATSKPEETETLGEMILTVVYAVCIVMGLRIFLFEPFNIPSESMMPNLVVGDYLFVSKYPYGYSKHSVPFSPDLFEGRIGESPVKRGDIVVFKLPRDNDTDYIKRIMGLPGDKLQMVRGQLIINGQPIKREKVDDFVIQESGNTQCDYAHLYRRTHEDGNTYCHYPQYRETLPDGTSYMTLDQLPEGPADNTREFTVPEGHYFAMGDNRDNSLDSRRPKSIGVGFVPAENLVGRAEMLFFSTDGDSAWWEIWHWFGATRFGRIFNSLRPDTTD